MFFIDCPDSALPCIKLENSVLIPNVEKKILKRIALKLRTIKNVLIIILKFCDWELYFLRK